MKKIFKNLFLGARVEDKYKAVRTYWNKGGLYRYLALFLTKKIQKDFGCYLSPKAIVGKNLRLPHPIGIVIGDGVVIGNNVTIYQSVTVGAAKLGDGSLGHYPAIKDNAVLFSGACIIGGIIVEESVIVGANAVLLKSTEKKSVYVGVPAKKVKD